MTTKASHPSLLIGIVLAADLAIAVLGIRSIAAAHSAEPVAQNGRLVWAEQDTQRTSNYWLLAIGTLRNRYRVETSDYSPDLPDLLGLVGRPVTIWTDGSSRSDSSRGRTPYAVRRSDRGGCAPTQALLCRKLKSSLNVARFDVLKAVVSICLHSFSSEGAITVVLGRQRR